MPKASKKPSHAKKMSTRVQKGKSRLAQVTLGDLGSALSQGWEGLKEVLPWNEETKLLDTVNAASPGTAGAVYGLSLIAQGDDYQSRDGNSVRALGLETRIAMILDAAARYDLVRCVVVVDHENRGATPAVTDILEAGSWNSQFNHDNLERFEVLHDKIYQISSSSSPVTHDTMKIVLGQHIRFSGAGGAATKEGSLWILFQPQENALPSQVSHKSRLSYVDN